MSKFKGSLRFFTALVTLCLLWISIDLISPRQAQAAFTNFITRSGDELRDGAATFQFVGVNIPGATVNRDKGYFSQHDDWEYEDLLTSSAQMGVDVVRTYTLPIGTVTGSYTYVNGIRSYNEANFRRLDKFLQLAQSHNIRVIIPFINCWSHTGGLQEFAAFRGKSAGAFFTDAVLKQDFKNFMEDVLNRTNYYTGVAYKDDKTILGWQLGNELDGNASWSEAWEVEMAAFLKGIDANHLVVSAAHVILTPPAALLNDANIDILSVHPYSYNGRPLNTYTDNYITGSKGKKPFIVGEYDDSNAANIATMMGKISTNSHFAGTMVWSLRGRTSIGGFYKHKEGASNWYSYNWPGHPAGESANNEITKLASLRSYAYQVKGLAVPALPAPTAPVMLSTSTKAAVRFKGGTGAATYEIQRATSPAGPWTTLTTTYSDYGQAYDHDVLIPYMPYLDATAPAGPVYYRARGANKDGAYGLYSDALLVEDNLELTNLVAVNPGFENGSTGWTLPASGNFSVTTADKHSGSSALLLNGVGNWSSVQYPHIPIASNTSYTLRFWAKSNSSNSNYKVLVQGASTTLAEGKLSNNNTWTQYTATFNSGANSTVRLYLGDGGGTVYYDDFELTGPSNWVAGSSGFENGSTGWTLPASGSFSVTTADKHSGGSALLLNGVGSWDSTQYPHIPVVSNTSYTLRFWAKSNSSTSNYKVLVQGASIALAEGNLSSNNTWTLYTATFNSGANSTVRLYLGDGGGTVYYDDFELTGPSNWITGSPGFENGSTGWTLPTPGNFSVTTSDKHSGSSALLLNGVGNWSSTQYPHIPVASNTSYTLRFWAKSNNSTSNYKVLVQGASTVLVEGNLSNNNTWSLYTATFNSGANSTVQLYLGDGGGTIYYDDFELIRNS